MKNIKPIDVGVVGCGWIMRSIYAPILLSLPDLVRVTAVCDLSESAAGAVAGRFVNASIFTDVQTMLQEAKPTAVLVLTSVRVNATVTRQVLKADVPVYLEKPPAVSPAELEELITAEAHSKTFVYTAFNRRHTPLFSTLDLSGVKLRRISGALKRLNRPVASFPHTAIHLIDSAQHYARSFFQSWEITFEQRVESSIWTINGKLENGAECVLQFVPDGSDFTEFLILEAETGTWELQFPNPAASVPEGEMIQRLKDGSPAAVVRGQKTVDSFIVEGFRSCMLDFIAHVENREVSTLHRLSPCRSTIRIMNEMEAQNGIIRKKH